RGRGRTRGGRRARGRGARGRRSGPIRARRRHADGSADDSQDDEPDHTSHHESVTAPPDSGTAEGAGRPQPFDDLVHRPAKRDSPRYFWAGLFEKPVVSEVAEGAFRRHYEHVYRYVRRRTHDHHRAEDLTQQVFADAVAGLHESSSPTLAWLYTVAKRRFADEARRETGPHTKETRRPPPPGPRRSFPP